MKYFPKVITIDWIKKSYIQGELTPEELAKEIVKRSEEYSEYNIWIVKPDFEQMKKYIARIKDKKEENLPLWGIPFAIKDNIDLKGVQTTAACKEYAYTPNENATVVNKLIEAGAIPVGKTNLDQFATGLVGMRSPYGEVHNALNPELISGGSSSGSAVSVALGMAAFSLGTDTAGSGRVPAALNDLVGYKPSLGAWSTHGVVPACASLDCVTVFANNLQDAVFVNEQVKGFDERCIWSREFPEIKRKLPETIYIPKDKPTFFGDFKEIYEKNWETAVKRIQMLGVKVEHIDCTMFSKAAAILYDGPWVAERWKDLSEFVECNPGKTFPVTEKILRSGDNEKHTAVSMFQAIHELQKYRSITTKLLKNSVFIMPTAGGTFTREQVRNNPIVTNSLMGLYTNHCNLLDLCAIDIPLHAEEQRMPFGITIFALSDSEGMIQETAATFLNTESIPLAVCGLHKKGMPLESQLTQLGAIYVESTKTSDKYRLYTLKTIPEKPGLVKGINGNKIDVDIYQVPICVFGKFMKNVALPLEIGNVELCDGRIVKGFLCEEYAVRDAEDITEKGYFG